MMTQDFFLNPDHLQGTACFISDTHFRTPQDQESWQRESLLVRFLGKEKIDHLFLLGDIFDFWFEYADVVPKGYFRLFNLLHEMHEGGANIYFFTGNHDMWVEDYFTKSFGCKVFREPHLFVLNGKRCLIGHGDGLGGKQPRYLFIKKVLGFGPDRFLYSLLHPRIAFAVARRCSAHSRASHPADVAVFRNETEHQVMFARETLQNNDVDFFILAHRHIPVVYPLNTRSKLFNAGDWLDHFSYILFKAGESEPELHFYDTANLS